jgi:hypothetical protein
MRDVGAASDGADATGAWLYILVCADSSYYVGTTRGSLDRALPSINREHSLATRRDDGP